MLSSIRSNIETSRDLSLWTSTIYLHCLLLFNQLWSPILSSFPLEDFMEDFVRCFVETQVTKHFLYQNSDIKIALLCFCKSLVAPRDDYVSTYKLPLCYFIGNICYGLMLNLTVMLMYWLGCVTFWLNFWSIIAMEDLQVYCFCWSVSVFL